MLITAHIWQKATLNKSIKWAFILLILLLVTGLATTLIPLLGLFIITGGYISVYRIVHKPAPNSTTPQPQSLAKPLWEGLNQNQLRAKIDQMHTDLTAAAERLEEHEHLFAVAAEWDKDQKQRIAELEAQLRHPASYDRFAHVGKMSRQEARDILGVTDTSTPDQIKAAHARVLFQNHPDRGGTTYLATLINVSRKTLLGR